MNTTKFQFSTLWFIVSPNPAVAGFCLHNSVHQAYSWATLINRIVAMATVTQAHHLSLQAPSAHGLVKFKG